VDTVEDFEDLLDLFGQHQVRYLIVGGLAFIYHAKPRYTKDMDLWLDSEAGNVRRANKALAAFGSPHLMDVENRDEILQIGIAPNRIDLLRDLAGPPFETAWQRRIAGTYGGFRVNWIDLESLLDIKSRIDHPRHQEDARVLRMVRDRRAGQRGEDE